MNWEMNIEKVTNGYVLKYYDEETEQNKTLVIEYKDTKSDTKMEQLTIREVFYQLLEYFAVYNDKHANNGEGQYLTIKVTGDEDD